MDHGRRTTTRPRKVGQCVFCRKTTELSRDHIPPKALFAEPRPSNLITVPSCDNCNHATALDEEYFAALLNFSAAGDSDEGQRLKAKWDRAYERGRGLLHKMRSSTAVVYEATPFDVRPRIAATTDMDSVDRVLDKVVRGLYHFEHHQVLHQDASEIVTILKDPRKSWPEDIDYSVSQGSRGWPGVFEYAVGAAIALVPHGIYPQLNVCRMRFYGVMEAMALWSDVA